MTLFRMRRSSLKGTIAIPPSKSHTLRAVLFAAMARGRSEVRQYLHSPDAHAMIAAMRQLGASIEVLPDRLRIEGLGGKVQCAENVVDAGNSGLVLRFIGALAALAPTYTVITGDHSIRHHRPVKPLLQALTALGAFAVSSRLDGMAPIIVKGPIRSGHATLCGEDSQPVSALLIAAAFLEGATTLTVTGAGEKPWIDLTLSWLRRFGVEVSHVDYSSYTIQGCGGFPGFDMDIPGDLSSAAFPIAAALITGSELSLTHVDLNDCQGDKKIIDVLIAMGAKIEWNEKEKTLTVRKGARLCGMKIDVNDFIDAVPVLSAIACFAQGNTEIVNAAIARKKESDRLHSIAVELRKMGAQIEEREEGLLITPGPLKGASVESHRDHRIAMALSVAAMGAEGETTIAGTECVEKTYPHFARDFRNCGASIEEV